MQFSAIIIEPAIQPNSLGSRYRSPLSSCDPLAVFRNAGGFFVDHSFQGKERTQT